jgi:dienelactone hydrolase
MTLEGPTAGQLKRMREEIQEDPEMTQQDLDHLRDWLNKQPHLPHHIGELV